MSNDPNNFSNGAQTTLSAAILFANNSSCTVTSAAGFPATPFRAIIKAEGSNKDEIVRVTNVAGTTFTIQRAVEPIADGTMVAYPHASGAVIAQVLTAESVVSIVGGRDLLTGQSQNFAGGIGNWTCSTGTLSSVNTSNHWVGTYADHMEWNATTSAGAYMEVPVPGTFKAGETYWAIVFLSNTATSGTPTMSVEIGKQGLWTVTSGVGIYADNDGPGSAGNSWVCAAVRFKTYSDITPVTLRLKQTSAAATTWHVGYAAVLTGLGDWGVPMIQVEDVTVIPMTFNRTAATIQSGFGVSGGIELSGYGSVDIGSQSSSSYPYAYISLSQRGRSIYFQGEHATTGDMADYGLDFEVGPDYVGIAMTEKDSSTVWLYPDWEDAGNSYDVELADRSATRGWRAADVDGNQTGMLSKSPFRSLDTAPTSPDEADCYYDTVIHKLRVWDGSAWQNCW